jgi:ABC-2 type transport system ATP-binding protein
MIEVRNLTKRYGDLVAVRGISFTADKGEILGFLGPNGAGKTTTMRIITGFMPATSGTVTVAGSTSSSKLRGAQAHRLPAGEPAALQRHDGVVLPVVRRPHQGPGPRRDPGRRRAGDRALRPHARSAAASLGHLSKGFRQRVGLAQALIHDPGVLVLDEPTIGLDPRRSSRSAR